MYRLILVPLDGSPTSEQVLPLAYHLAQRSDAALRLVHVHRTASATPISIEGLPVIDTELHSRVREHEQVYLTRMAERLTVAYGIACSSAHLHGAGSVAALIVDEACSSDADLIVMTPHGHSGFAHLWLGSVAEHLIRVSPLPVLLVRPRSDPAAASELPHLTEMLIPLDGSTFAEHILEPAAQQGQVLGTASTLLHVVAPRAMLHDDDPTIAPVDLDPDGTERHVVEAEAYLARIAQRCALDGRPVATRVLVGVQPAATIVEAVQAQPHTILAIATHGRSGLQRLLWGSVADKLLRSSTCPLLVYRPQPPDEQTEA